MSSDFDAVLAHAVAPGARSMTVTRGIPSTADGVQVGDEVLLLDKQQVIASTFLRLILPVRAPYPAGTPVAPWVRAAF